MTGNEPVLNEAENAVRSVVEGPEKMAKAKGSFMGEYFAERFR